MSLCVVGISQHHTVVLSLCRTKHASRRYGGTPLTFLLPDASIVHVMGIDIYVTTAYQILGGVVLSYWKTITIRHNVADGYTDAQNFL